MGSQAGLMITKTLEKKKSITPQMNWTHGQHGSTSKRLYSIYRMPFCWINNFSNCIPALRTQCKYRRANMMITHKSLCCSLERMNRKWLAIVCIHYSLSTVLHVNNLCNDIKETIIGSSTYTTSTHFTVCTQGYLTSS